MNSKDPSGLDNYDTVPSGYNGSTIQCLAGTNTYSIIVNPGESSAQACNRALPNQNAVDLGGCAGGCSGSNGMQGGGTQGAPDFPWNNNRAQSTQTPEAFQEMVNQTLITGGLLVPDPWLEVLEAPKWAKLGWGLVEGIIDYYDFKPKGQGGQTSMLASPCP